MTRFTTLVACFTLACAAALVVAAEKSEVKSGLQPGEKPPAYQVLDATGPNQGKKLCYRCKYSGRPTVNIFTRELNDSVAKLVKDIDGKVEANSGKKMSAFVVLLTDEPDSATEKLQAFAKQHNIKHTPLTTFENTSGPGSYKIAKDAQVTVMMWNKNVVRSNHAFTSAELPSDAVKVVVEDTGKILD